MLGQTWPELAVLDCEPELVWPAIDVDDEAVLDVLAAAKAMPTEDNAATTETASIE